MDIFVGSMLCQWWLQHHSCLKRDANILLLHGISSDTINSYALLDRAQRVLQNHPYKPFLYCSFDIHGQLQTTVQFVIRNIGALYLTCRGQAMYKRELVSMRDGAVIALDWAVPPLAPTTTAAPSSTSSSEVNSADLDMRRGDESGGDIPIVILHHGLCGDSSSEHVVFMVRKFLTCTVRKFRVVVVVARGCGGLELTTPHTMHGARTGDLREAIEHIRSKSPNARLFGIGFSLGAGLMLKYLGEEGEGCVLEAAMCVSPPWDGRKQTPFFPLWSLFLAVPVKLYALKHRNRLGEGLSLRRILCALTLSQVDAQLAASYGFDGLGHYYSSCSPVPLAHRIAVPTLSLSARDDPVCFHGAAPAPGPSPAPFSPGLDVSPPPSSSSHMFMSLKNDDKGSDRNGDVVDDSSKSGDRHCAHRNSPMAAEGSSLSTPSPPSRLLILKTLLGGHLAFPSSSSSSSLSSWFPLSEWCASWCDDVALDWVLSFF